MLKKILFGTLTILFAFSVLGCGGGDTPAKPADDKKEVSADKAIITYAELLMTGESAGADDLGLTDVEKAELTNRQAKETIEFCGDTIPLNEQSVKAISDKFHDKSKEMQFTATVKKDDAEHPVIELKATPWGASPSTESEDASKDFGALLDMNVQLRDDGSTPDQIKENADFQALAVKAFDESFQPFTFTVEKTLDVTCNKVNGHWAPTNADELFYFLAGIDIEKLNEIIKDVNAQQ